MGYARSRLISCGGKTVLRSLVFIPVLTIGFAVPAKAQQKAELPKEAGPAAAEGATTSLKTSI
jgi:hypothetical protein